MPGLQPVGGDSPGRVLRSAREALGLSRREIAEALNLLESTVVAIEDDDAARQPEPVFLRGYVRNYAKLLRLDPEPLVIALNSERRPAATPVKVPKPLASNRWLWPVAGALLATLILAATVVYLLEAPTQTTSALEDGAAMDDAFLEDAGATAEVEAEEQSVVPKVDRWDPSIPPAVVDNTPTGVAPSVFAVDGTPESGAALAPVHETGTPLGETERVSQPVVNPLTAALTQPTSADDEAAVEAGGDADPDSVDVLVTAGTVTTVKPRRLNRGTDQIRLDFAEDCWVRVKDTTGKMLFSDMGRAGGAMELTGTGPFDLLLGNAPGTTLKWNREPIALQPFMRNNVATLKLGETPLAKVDEPTPQ